MYQTKDLHFSKGSKYCFSEFVPYSPGIQYTGWGKTRFTVVCMENNTIINKY